MTTNLEEEVFYTLPETMDLLHVSRRTVYTYLTTGKLEGTKTAAGTWRIPRSSVLRFLGLADAPAEAFNEDTLKMAKEAIGE